MFLDKNVQGMIVRMKNKYKVLIVLISVIITLITCFYILDGYYSVDLHRIITQGYTKYAIDDAYIRDGRLFSAIIFVLIGFINPNLKILYIINLISAIFILSFGVLEIYKIIEHYKESKNTKDRILKFIISYICIFSFVTVDIIQYVDAFIISTSILLFIKAAKKIVIQKQIKLGFIFTLIGVFCYQGTISIYIATVVLLAFLENKKMNKKFFIDLLKGALIVIVATAINYAMVLILPQLFGLEQGKRLTTTPLKNFIYHLNSMCIYMFYNIRFFPQYLWITYIIICIVIIGIYCIKNRQIDKMIYMLFLVFFCIISIFPLMIVSIQIFARTLGSWGELMGIIMIYMYCETQIFERTKGKIINKMIYLILISYFIINLGNSIYHTKIFDMSNKMDIYFSNLIKEKVNQAEKNGQKITQMSIDFINDGKLQKKYENLRNIQSLYFKGLYDNEILKFYTGLELEQSVDKEQFNNNNFDMDSEEEIQIKTVNDTVYILINI